MEEFVCITPNNTLATPPHLGTTPYYRTSPPPAPPGYYYYGTPPQTIWHRQHQHLQQYPTHYGMHQIPPHHMQYHQSLYQILHGGFTHTVVSPPFNLDETHTTEGTKEKRTKCAHLACGVDMDDAITRDVLIQFGREDFAGRIVIRGGLKRCTYGGMYQWSC